MNNQCLPRTNIDVIKLVIVAIGFFISLAAFFPGFMSADSLAQYSSSKTLIFNDWHPPIMSWLWSIFNLLFDGPEGLLIFNLLLFWAALYIWHEHFRDRKYAWLILLIGFLPWIINFSGVLWKDVGMAFSLLLLSGIGISKVSPGRIFSLLVVLFYAINLRYNALFSALPLLILITANWFPRLSTIKLLMLPAGALILTVIGGGFFNNYVLDSIKTKPSNYMLVDDLAYLSLTAKKSLIPGVAFEDIQNCSTYEIGDNELVGKVFCLQNHESYITSKPLNTELKTIWTTEVIKQPFEYIGYRLAAFSYLLRSPDDEPYYIWHPGIDKNQMGITQKKNGLTVLVDKLVHGTAQALPFIFKPYWWLWISSLLLLTTFATKQNASTRTIQALLVSSLLYILSYIPITPMADFRYIYWSVIATTLAGILLIIDRPTLIISSTKRKGFLGFIAISTSAFIFFFGRIAVVDVDGKLIETLPVRQNVSTIPRYFDVTLDSHDYLISGSDPQLVYDIEITSSEVRFFSLNFKCLDQQSTPRLQVFWWGDGQVGPSEQKSMTFIGKAGINIASLAEQPTWKSIKKISGFRIDLSDPSSCKKITLGDLVFYK